MLRKWIGGRYSGLKRRRYLRRWLSAGPSRPGEAGGKRFLVLDHSYALDAEALCAADAPHEIWVIGLGAFAGVTRYFRPEHRDLRVAYDSAAMRHEVARFKRMFARPLVERLMHEVGFDAFIVPSDVFYWVRPIIEEFRARGVPTVVQDKEGTLVDAPMMDEHAAIVRERYPPIADLYLLWNESHLRFWLKAGLSAGRAEVLGQPRADFFAHPHRWPTKAHLGLPPDKRLVAAFTFDADAYVVCPGSAAGATSAPWKDLRDQLHSTLRRIVSTRDDVHVVVKAHPQQADLPALVQEFRANPTPGVELATGSATASHLIVNADVVVGFQSTVMIEAMLTDKPILYAGFGPQHDALEGELLPIHRSGGCFVPANVDELGDFIHAALDGRVSVDESARLARRGFAGRYFGAGDGRVAERVLSRVSELVDELRR